MAQQNRLLRWAVLASHTQSPSDPPDPPAIRVHTSNLTSAPVPRLYIRSSYRIFLQGKGQRKEKKKGWPRPEDADSAKRVRRRFPLQRPNIINMEATAELAGRNRIQVWGHFRNALCPPAPGLKLTVLSAAPKWE